MQWSLFVLILMGQCSFSTCHLYEYHFIREGQSWEEAQSYCREHFTDLATVTAQSYCRAHHTDLVSGITQIRSEEFKSKVGPDWLWIGLFREIWSWSDGKNFSFRHWEDSFLYIHKDKVILINEKKTWDEALDYCRANHRDLVSITDRHQEQREYIAIS
ncbi:L-selectin-like [Pseudochaenichthys georgianus]|uniref:L-selectin-like n=1 Tax=Pseudochaenichthys georgianus TaxID=52239 RepID=UPI0039C1A15D